MPLQIRRGTTAQRLSITPLVSELVYDITTKLVYVGDGVTAGGIAIDQDSSPDFPLGDLSDIDLDNLAEGDILRYDGNDWVNDELSLNSLDAVTITAPANNDIIKFNGTNWVNSGLSFSTLPGVNLNSPEVNQVLKFNGTSWSNQNEDSSLVVSALDDLTNVEITDVVVDQVLRYDGTNWINDNESVPDLSDLNTVVITDLIANQFLKYDGANWVNSNTFDGDVTGSVFSDTSTLLVDGVSGQIVGDINARLGGNLNLNSFSINGTGEISITGGLNMSFFETTNINLTRFRGTAETPLSVLNTSGLGGLRFSGFNGIADVVGAEIRAVVSSAGSLGSGMPTSLDFVLNNTDNEFTSIFTMNGEDARVQCNESSFFIIYNSHLPDSAAPQLAIVQHHEVADGNNFSFLRGRGTNLAPAAIQSGDDFVDMTFLGHNGTTYVNGASISVICTGTPTFTGVPSQMVFRTNTGTASATRLTIQSTGEVIASVALLNNGTGGIGYSAGAGGTETQTTNKSTAVVLNKITGEITLHNEVLAAGSAVTFTLTNSTIAANDHVIVTHISAGSLGAYNLTAIASAGSAAVTLRNLTSSGLGEAIVIKYSVIKSTVS
jgi:hypothetical protein